MRRHPLHTPWASTTIRYLNIPLVRMALLSIAYCIAAFRMEADIVISYNSYSYNVLTALAQKFALGRKWVAVVADVEATVFGSAWHNITERFADGCVYLSAALADESSRPPAVLHLDGGIEPLSFDVTESGRSSLRICYAGSFHPSAGAENLLQAVRQMRREDIQLDLYGAGYPDRLQQLANGDPRIRIHGLVDREDLENSLATATVLVNPRPTTGTFAVSTFPSKILEYLRYGVPIVSTWTPGLSRNYRELLILTDGDAPDDIQRALDLALGLEKEDREIIRKRIHNFAATHSWEMQTVRLREFLARVLRQSTRRS